MAVIRVQHIFNHRSGLPEDAIVNTWYFSNGVSGLANTAAATALTPIVDAFYNTNGGTATVPMGSMIASIQMADPRATYKYYDMSAPLPRVPFATITPTQSVANGALASLPSEVCACLSYRGAIVSGTAPARRRGRLYIGPLNNTSGTIVGDVTTLAARVHGNLALTATQNAKRLKTDALAAGFEWGVYSETLRAGNAAIQGFTPITHVWMDNSFDIQRRRGVAPTSRTATDI